MSTSGLDQSLRHSTSQSQCHLNELVENIFTGLSSVITQDFLAVSQDSVTLKELRIGPPGKKKHNEIAK